MIYTTFYTGSKIRIILKTGEQVIAKFKQNKNGELIETDKGNFRVLDIRSANYYKPHPHEI